MPEPDFPDILQHFALSGHFESAEEFGSGHINDTWMIRFVHSDARKRYVLQRINSYVFADPVAVSENIDRVCRHMRDVAGRYRRLPGQADFVPVGTRSEASYWQEPDGEVWRLWPFVYGAGTVDTVESPRQAREAGAAFGWFQRLLADLPGPPLHETIPGFHDTLARFDLFRMALTDDSARRASACSDEIEFALGAEPVIRRFAELAASGVLRVRIAHNDAKINNVMLDDRTGEAICVIDLDTVMPGLAHYDFGDMVRTMTVTAAEDEADLDEVVMNIGHYEALADGYLGAVAGMLTGDEIALLPEAGRIITLETGLRFLTDHLSGDPYFRIARPDHNLDRCRTQFALARSIGAQLDAMRSLTDQAADRHRAAAERH